MNQRRKGPGADTGNPGHFANADKSRSSAGQVLTQPDPLEGLEFDINRESTQSGDYYRVRMTRDGRTLVLHWSDDQEPQPEAMMDFIADGIRNGEYPDSMESGLRRVLGDEDYSQYVYNKSAKEAQLPFISQPNYVSHPNDPYLSYKIGLDKLTEMHYSIQGRKVLDKDTGDEFHLGQFESFNSAIAEMEEAETCGWWADELSELRGTHIDDESARLVRLREFEGFLGDRSKLYLNAWRDQ